MHPRPRKSQFYDISWRFGCGSGSTFRLSFEGDQRKKGRQLFQEKSAHPDKIMATPMVGRLLTEGTHAPIVLSLRLCTSLNVTLWSLFVYCNQPTFVLYYIGGSGRVNSEPLHAKKREIFRFFARLWRSSFTGPMYSARGPIRPPNYA